MRWFVGWIACGLVSLALQAHAQTASYRTIVVFGDTQTLVSRRAPELDRMVQWVLDARERERIDMVLHVGDLINVGLERGKAGRWPLPKDACAGSIEENRRCEAQNAKGASGVSPSNASAICSVPSHQQCREHCEKNADALAPGCYRDSPGPCRSCVRDRAGLDAEWELFERSWRRFDGVIPYAVVRGNHDNRGTARADAVLDGHGFHQRFGEERFRRLFSAKDPASAFAARRYLGAFLYLGDPNAGGAHAWILPLGGRDVLVIGPSWNPSRAELSWVLRVLDLHPKLPVILLGHTLDVQVSRGHSRALLIQLGLVPSALGGVPVSPHGRRVILTAAGHWIRDFKGLTRRPDGTTTLHTTVNYQDGKTPCPDCLALVRFHEGGDRGFDRVEALTIRPDADAPGGYREHEPARTHLGPLPFRMGGE